MKYTKDFLPKKGDRVIAKCYSSRERCRVISFDDDQITVKHLVYGFHTRKIEDVDFLYECPWYLFWQRH